MAKILSLPLVRVYIGDSKREVLVAAAAKKRREYGWGGGMRGAGGPGEVFRGVW